MHSLVTCPVCSASVLERDINRHLDSDCHADITTPSSSFKTQANSSPTESNSISSKNIAPVFKQSVGKKRSIERPSTNSKSTRPEKRQKVLKDVIPLAERCRPESFSDFVGQDHLIGPDALLRHILQGENGCAGSMILWGPSGCGKTTLARLLVKHTNAVFKELSATSSGTNDVRAIFEEAKASLSLTGT